MILDRNKGPETVDIKEIKVNYPKQITLYSGHTCYLDEYDSELVQVTFMWLHGFDSKPPLVSTLLSALMFTKTADKNVYEINKMMKSNGCAYSFSVSNSYSQLRTTCLAKNFEHVLDDFLNLFLTAQIDEAEFEMIIKAEISNLKSKQNTPAYWCTKNSKSLNFSPTHPKGRIIEINDYELLQPKNIEDQLSNYKLEDTLVFITASKPKTIAEIIEKKLNNYKQIKSPKLQVTNYYEPSPHYGKTVKHRVANTNQVALRATFLAPAFSLNEYHKLQFMSIMVGGFFGSRLMKEVREKQGLTYGIGSSTKQEFGLYEFIINSQLNAKNTTAAIDSITEILKTLQKNGFTTEELDRGKRYFIGQLYSTLDKPGNLVEKVIYAKSLDIPENAFVQKFETVKKCTLEELNALTTRLIDIERLNWSLAGDV